MRAARLVLAGVIAVAVAAAAPARAAPRWQTVPLPLPAMPAPTSSGHVEVGGASIYYATYGRPDAAREPVILLHGGLGNGDHFAHQIATLAGKVRVIAIDSRGQGRSTLGAGKLSYRAMADDVIAVMDHLQVARAALAGWSDGGAIALDLAIRRPERVAKLFVFGTHYDARGAKAPKRPSPTFAAYAAKCREDARRFGQSAKAYDAAAQALRPVWRGATGLTADGLRAIRAPALLVAASHDEIVVTAHVRDMARLIPGAKFAELADTSHFALWQDPDGFNALLLELVQ